jgi:hypothetical protein
MGRVMSVIIAVIVACEVGFWVLLAAGLLARYGLRSPRLGAALLIGVPVVDLVLLVATVIDLRSGTVATSAHGLAAVYLGFSVAFGHRTIRAVDERVAHRFAGGPAPVKPNRDAAHEWAQWLRGLAAWAIACGLLGLAIRLVNDGARTAELASWIEGLTAGLVIWLAVGPLWTSGRQLIKL